MKVSEFKNLEEGFFSDLVGVGSDVMSTVKSSPDYQKSQKDKQKERINVETQKRYLQDFIEDLVVDLDAAIKGGRVNTSAVSSPVANSAGTAQTQQTQQPQQPITQQPASTAQPQQAVQPTAATRQAALQRSQQRKAQRQSAKSVDREEELAGVADLGYNEGYHSFLNTLVEGYINEQQQMPISEWIMMWFAAYMKGVNWESDKAGVETIAKEIQSSYSKDRGKAAISKLANSSWNLIKDVDTIPYGAQDVMGAPGTTNNTNLNDRELAKKIKDDADKLKKSNPDLYNKIKSSLSEKRVYYK